MNAPPRIRCSTFDPAGACRQKGFTLTELMVAITISLLVMVALSSVFINITRSNGEMANASRQIENGRLAMQLLQNDIAHAGFWGEYVPQFQDLTAAGIPADVPDSIPNPCLAYTPADWTVAHQKNLIGIAVHANDAIWSACASLLTNKQPDTDVIVVRHAEICAVGEVQCEADTSGKLYFQSSLCANEAGSPYELGTTGFLLHKRDCTTLANKRKFVSTIYYIRDHATAPGDAIPTLVRSQFDLASGTLAHQAPVALIEGIEGFRVEFGIDSLSDTGAPVNYAQSIAWANSASLTSPTNRGDGIPDGPFIRCTTAAPCTAAQMSNAVAMKVHLVARGGDMTPGYTDTKTYTMAGINWTPVNLRYKRHLFSSTVRLTNISGRRETP
ncbi:MAG: PilW family protein [Pseudomonadota bacterium]